MEASALVMISRAPIKIPDSDENLDGGTPPQPIPPTTTGATEETDGYVNPLPLDMSAAIPPKKNTKRAQVKNRDWRASIQAYNEL